MYFISKLMRSKLGKKHNLLFFVLGRAFLGTDHYFLRAMGCAGSLANFQKKLSCRTKLKKNAEKIHTEWEPMGKKNYFYH